MVFTPGDIVYSSSKFINTSKPNIKLENLLSLMHHNKISFNLLKNTLKNFKKFHIHVLGDTIIDKQTITSLIGGNTKTPTHSVSFQEEKLIRCRNRRETFESFWSKGYIYYCYW